MIPDCLIKFTVPGLPVAQPRQRHRVVTSGGKSFASNYTPTRDPVNAFKASVQMAAQAAYSGPPLEGPLRMDLEFVFPRPKSVPKKLGTGRQWHIVKPDRDNVQKSLQDALNGILYRDDSQICAGNVAKYRAAEDEQPHVTVFVWRLLEECGPQLGAEERLEILEEAVRKTVEENRHLADGEDCTLRWLVAGLFKISGIAKKQRLALQIIKTWAFCDGSSPETRSKAMSDIAGKCREALS